MASPKSPQSKKRIYLLAGSAVVLFVAGLALVVSLLLRNDDGGRKKQMQMVTLLAPPPPPKIVEKLPEPEKIEEKIETPPEEKPAEEPETAKEPPPSENLGLDADAGLGGDEFGLQAKKGGSSLIGGNGGSLHSWYANIVSNDLQKIANDIIKEAGGVPSGQWKKVRIELKLDVFGNIQRHSLLTSSGNEIIDKAVKEALRRKNKFEPPPPSMPHVLKIDVMLQG